MKRMLMLVVVMGIGMLGLGMAQGAILHDIPGGDGTVLPDGINCTVNDSFGMPAGYWNSYRGWTGAGIARATGTETDRHIEIGAGWYPDDASVWYIDYQQTPAGSAWKISADLKWAGGSGNNLRLGLYQDEGGNVGNFGFTWTGTNISWGAGSASGSFTSATGLDNTYRTVSIEYDPLTGRAVGKLGSETVFQTTTETGLTVKRVQFSVSMPAPYDTAVMSVDNITAQVPEPVTLGLLLTGGVMLLKRRNIK